MAPTSDQGDSGQDAGNAPTDASNIVDNATSTTTTDAATTLIDKDFDPSAQALIDEIDDERTLEEEEALAAADSSGVQNELDDLKRESEMPIEELLAYYERIRNEASEEPGEEEYDLEDDYSYSSNDEYDDQRGWRRVIHVGPEYQADVPDGLSEYESDLPPYENEDVLVWKCNPEQTQEQILDYLKQASVIPKRNDISLSPASVPKISDHYMRLFREKTQEPGSASSGSQLPEQDQKRVNNENPLKNQTDVYMLQSRKRLRIEHEIARDIAMDGLLNQSSIENNLQADPSPDASRRCPNSEPQDTKPELSTDEYFQGEEQLLFLLLQCNHNFNEALRRRALDPFKYYISEPMSLWSQDECLGFENGLRTCGKNFRLIRENEVPTRTRAEVVAFYYLWKKSERHDVYTNQYKIDRKRSLTHPGTTDYMDKFIEDNESALNASWSTDTPTPTESTAENNQSSQVSHVNDQPIAGCQESTLRTSLTECSKHGEELSVVADCIDQVGNLQQSNGDEM